MATPPQPTQPLTSQEELGAVLPEILPEQGMWTDEQYLWLTDDSNRLVEFTDAYVEVLPMPTDTHQTILLYLYERFVSFVRPRGGKVLVAALRLRIRPGKYREPDLLVLDDANDPRREDRFWLGAGGQPRQTGPRPGHQARRLPRGWNHRRDHQRTSQSRGAEGDLANLGGGA